MGDNDAAAKYVILSFLFQFLLEFLLLVSVVDAIGLSCLDVICSSTLLVCTISLFIFFIVMIYQLLVRIISYGYLLIYSTIQNLIIGKSIQAALLPLLDLPSMMVCITRGGAQRQFYGLQT